MSQLSPASGKLDAMDHGPTNPNSVSQFKQPTLSILEVTTHGYSICYF